MAQKLKLKIAKSPSTKNTKHLCKSNCYAVTNHELTSSHILSLNSYTSIDGAVVTLRMLSKQKNSTHNSRQDYFLLKSRHQNWTTDGGLFQVHTGNVNHIVREEVFHSKSILLKELAVPR